MSSLISHKKIFSKTILIFLLGVMLVPQLANASWYAPWTWGWWDWAYRPTDSRLKPTKENMQAMIDRLNGVLSGGTNPQTGEPLTEKQKKGIQENINYVQNQMNTLTQSSQDAYDEAQGDMATCSLGSTFSLGACVIGLFAWIGTIITWLVGLSLWVVGEIFDLAVWMSIAGLSGPTGWFNVSGVKIAWTTLRDLANICFIFVLLYIALGTIFDLSGIGGNAQKLIVNVVIVALLVNFSGFFVRVVVDASNILAYEFYMSMDGGNSGQTYAINNIGFRFVQRLGLGSMVVKGASGTLADSKVNRMSFLGIIGQTLGNVILILVTTFVLLTAAILFFIRSIVLVLIYIFAPVAIVFSIVPGQQKVFNQWRDKLISQSFFAPAFLIPLYVVFLILGNGFSALVGSTGGLIDGTLTLAFFDCFIIGLTLGCIVLANQFGAMGAKGATALAGTGTLLAAKGGSWAAKRMAKSETYRTAYNKVNQWSGGRVNRAVSTMRDYGRTNLSEKFENSRFGQSTIGQRISSAALVTEGAVRAASQATTRAASYSAGQAKAAWDSEPGKNLRKSEFGKKVKDIVEHPLVNANEYIVKAANMSGSGSYAFLGKTSKERKDAEKEAKEEKEKEKKEELKDKGNQLSAAAKINDNAKIDEVLNSIATKDIDKIDKKTLISITKRIPYLHLLSLQNKLKDLDFTPAELDKMKSDILGDQNSVGYDFMATGPGREKWGTPARRQGGGQNPPTPGQNN